MLALFNAPCPSRLAVEIAAIFAIIVPMKENIHPPMHTAEHLLNQTMHRLFKTGRCFGSHIEKRKSKCDYRFSRDLSAEELKMLEKKMNSLIDADLPVSESFVSAGAAKNIYLRYEIDKLPENPSGRYRIIKIGDYDEILCYGPHVSSTGKIGGFKIISASHGEGVLRIRYKLK